MTEKLISVVVPCYNVEGYVAKCLDSVVNQTYKNLEIIIVDDGSTDSTASIITNYKSDYRVKVIVQQNAGVSAARNVGIEQANGEYIAFVDSDDWLEADMYLQLYTALICNNADIAVCNYNIVYDDHESRQYSKPCSETIDLQSDVYGYFLRFCTCPKPNNYIWTRLYNTDIVKRSGVRFENYKLGDDTLFNFKLLPYIKGITWIPAGLYNYYQRTSSNIYTVAKKCNLATVYADTFDALANYYTDHNFMDFLSVLPVHAFTRLRSIFFYSRLAGLEDCKIVENIMIGFQDRKIWKYLTGEFV